MCVCVCVWKAGRLCGFRPLLVTLAEELTPPTHNNNMLRMYSLGWSVMLRLSGPWSTNTHTASSPWGIRSEETIQYVFICFIQLHSLPDSNLLSGLLCSREPGALRAEQPSLSVPLSDLRITKDAGELSPARESSHWPTPGAAESNYETFLSGVLQRSHCLTPVCWWVLEGHSIFKEALSICGHACVCNDWHK